MGFGKQRGAGFLLVFLFCGGHVTANGRIVWGPAGDVAGLMQCVKGTGLVQLFINTTTWSLPLDMATM